MGKRPALTMLVWLCPAQGLDPELVEVTDVLIRGQADVSPKSGIFWVPPPLCFMEEMTDTLKLLAAVVLRPWS